MYDYKQIQDYISNPYSLRLKYYHYVCSNPNVLGLTEEAVRRLRVVLRLVITNEVDDMFNIEVIKSMSPEDVTTITDISTRYKKKSIYNIMKELGIDVPKYLLKGAYNDIL